LSFNHLSLDELIARDSQSNRRATVRYRCAPATPGKILLSDDHELQKGWVIDLSAKGIGVQLGRPLAKGTSLVVHMKSNSDPKKTFQLHARVMHARQLPSGDWHVGCELLEFLKPEDLDQLL
jgi:hypothetical protein